MTKKVIMLQYFLKEVDRIDFEIQQHILRFRSRRTDVNDCVELAILLNERDVVRRVYTHFKAIFELIDDDENRYSDVFVKRM